MRYKLLLLLILLIPLAQAADTDLAIDWLEDQPKTTIASLSFSILTTNELRSSLTSGLKSELNSRKSSDNCWPLGACSIKETSLALLAQKQSPSANGWLITKQIADPEGKWLLQIETDGIGTCTINYPGKSISVNVNRGRISSSLCSTPTTLFDLNTCLEPNLVSSNKEIDFTVTCSNLGNAIISAAYNLGNLYIPIGEASSALSSIIKIRNSYFLDFESTLYTNWAYKEANQQPPSIVWLKKNYNEDNILHNALLYVITEDRAYIQQILDKQTDQGNLGSYYETALATYALRKDNQEEAAISLATSWLDAQQAPEGHWAGSVENTAVILFGAYTPILGRAAPTTTPTPTTTEVCKANDLCEVEWGETASNCPADCSCGDAICDSSERPETCPQDCGEPEPESICGDDVCDFDEDEETCPVDCEEGRMFFWFVLLLFLALIAGLIYFYYTKFYKKGRKILPMIKGILTRFKKTTTKKPLTGEIKLPAAQPRRTVAYSVPAPKRKTKLEKELEKSLAEAKKVLKK